MGSERAGMAHGAIVRQWQWPLHMAFWWVVIAAGVWAWAVAAQWYWAGPAGMAGTAGMAAAAGLAGHADRPSAPQRVSQMQAALQANLDTLDTLHPALFEPRALADGIHDAIHTHVVLVALEFSRALMDWPAHFKALGAGRPKPADPGGHFMAAQLRSPAPTWTMLVVGTQIFASRTAMYLSAAPAFALAAALGLADGLVARARRKACAGRESASVYHRAKLGWSFSLITGYLVWLGLPSITEPQTALLSLCALAGLLVRMQAAFYKKYV